MHNKKTVFLVAALVVAVLGLALAGCVLFRERQAEVEEVTVLQDASAGALVAQNNMPAALRIFRQSASQLVVGSGFYIGKDGYAVTNAHVVTGGGSLYVEDYNGETHPAQLLHADDSIDIAVIKVGVWVDQSYMKFASSGDIQNACPGDEIFFIGNPSNLGFLIGTGVLSATGVDLKNGSGYTMESLIVDASINHGNSGGALLNKNGAVIGVIFARMEHESSGVGQTEDIYGLGCAVPSDTVTAYLDKCGVDYESVQPGESVWGKR